MPVTLPRPSKTSCPPRWGTRRTDRPTLGPKLAAVAELLGTPLMPWQRHVADVALEVDPATGLLVYREVNLTVPRQSGKTLLLLCAMVHRAQGFGRRQGIVYTAQTRNDARKKWENEHVEVLRRSPLKSLFSVRKSNGSEAILWRNGSMHGITSSTEKAGHGETLDMGVIDEAFAHEDSRLEQGLRPTMITRPQPQLWVVSTAGTRKSVFLRGKVDAGRVRCDLGLTDSVAYFEWSASGDADPADPETWWSCMPALGHTVTEDAIRSEFEGMPLAEFRRAFLNQWPDDAPDEWLVVPRATWAALADPASQIAGQMCFSADINPERSHGAIASAGLRTDGRMSVEVVEHKRGTGWMVARAVELDQQWKPIGWVVDAAGPAGSLVALMEAAGLNVIKPTARDATHSAQGFYDACETNDLRHLDDPVLNSALAGAQRRPLGDAWAWARKGLSTDISPLVAAAYARWGFVTRERDEIKPPPATVRTAAPQTGGNNSLWRPTSRLNL
ncbi:MAG: terminase large subunit domain-containing protein [Nocardioidaceae bacterium]